ncbi:MAG: hypothetical protein C0481_15375 [Phenylobacterium sp.]|uniref:tellurite resistance TerB family protein n=1 Tax=Phenylobacterium sp. TaxID=1871053 RepID=UPI0025CCC1BA|nr:TerB family tellurite resistance protein [Phenylobacterium sp.]MBA4013246.1 hypothetical protein [Phenylobacterium sp.]
MSEALRGLLPRGAELDEARDRARLVDLDVVIAEPLKFKRKLRIGEDAYIALRATKGIRELWDVGGVASTGAAVASSHVVASTFFSGGLLSVLGIGAAATPIGWVVAAAAVSGGAYYGVSRLARRHHGRFVDTIPRFINTPLDSLGMDLLDLICALALRVAAIDGSVAPEEREEIWRHFVDEWGYDPVYVATALDILQTTADDVRVKAVAQNLAQFQAANPDCNAQAMQDEVMVFLRQVVEADGYIDEREELAIDAIAEVFRKERTVTLAKVGQGVADAGGTAKAAVSEFAKRVGGLRSRPSK